MNGPVVVPRLVSWDGTSIPHTNESPQAASGTTSSEQVNTKDYSAPAISRSKTPLSTVAEQMSITLASSEDDLTQSLATKQQDVDRYIALGCLHFRDSILPSHKSQAHIEWMELLYHGLPEEVKAIIGNETSRLLEAHWIRLFLRNFAPGTAPFQSSVRVYLMPEDWGRRSVDRNSKKLKAALRHLLKSIDISTKAWYGDPNENEIHYFDPWAGAELSSLYYLFNKLPSPAPVQGEIRDRYTRAAVNDLLESATVSGWDEYGEQALPGLRTRLYAYQARSASAMLQREAAPQLQLDPRLEVRSSPDGKKFYFGSRDGSFLQEPRYYEITRGGILAETMGLGKTVICLAVILASKYHLPKIPAAYRPPPPVRHRVGKLSDMAASILGRYSVPARGFLEQSEMNGAGDMTKYRNALDRNIPFYEIPAELSRINRSARLPPPRQLIISSATIVVVPRNLLHQWQSEIKKHVLQGGLKVLVLDTVTKRGSKVQSNLYDDDNMQFRSELPVPTELMKFDVILFTRNRFEQEIQDGQDDQGRRAVRGVTRVCKCSYIGASRVPDCNCVDYDKFYESPLKKIHWLRIIIDEGHSFSSSLSNAVLVAKQIEAERRWVVSGTPAKNLVGVEVDMATMETEGDTALQRELAIEQRKSFNLDPDNLKAAKALGVLASNFLMARPWCDSSEGKLDWEEHIYRHEHQYRKTYSGFSSGFLRTLEGLLVKTRPEDVEKDIILPPMRHRAVFLKPCWYDKMTANLFVQVLRANAITSERTDVDYLFHKNSVKERHALIRNLRQSNFTWTGFSLLDVVATLETSSKYLAKEGINCSIEDSQALLESCQVISRLTTSEGWKALSNAHEVGMAVKDWPRESRSTFALGDAAEPTMIGITQLIEGQLHVDGNILSHDPAAGLEAVGCEAKAKVAALAEAEGRAQDSDKKSMAGSPSNKAGVPLSLIDGHQSPSSRRTLVTTGPSFSQRQSENSTNDTAAGLAVVTSSLRSKKRKLTLADEAANLPTSSPLHDTQIVGTTSAKLSYLLDKVMQHQATEKIIIFYDGDDAAWYIAQCLELMYVNHRIYARNLENTLRSEYVRLFAEDPDIRVLMIDVACGALGLNLNAASIVLISNPIHRPNIEAQAIKRAHRIGQTKEVLVETLVLENTIEHAIFNRAKTMTRADHQEAKELEDDADIVEIIQNAQILPVGEDEGEGLSSFALLQTPQKVFGRPNRHKYHRFGGTGSKSVEKPSKKAKTSKGGANGAEEMVSVETGMTPERESPETVISQVYKVVSGLGSSIFGSG
ncbi:hypothetical protein COCMIDRAFT_957 [Bipolaris oryzae ATCC 44560]|uniref:Helicase C-terminal domain-containing protein n=1 Tax=Bipolaris oryzae ATCC 44560 TaxID=930090 RepID=W6ZKA4_COCMI|nr:uncharacterized protein COCMIDRAFT_957 [Bipolaris oryzae ATCC 44560]EUC50515.1 hypothetical protein COCMIDRAFT_957 [Bipolaris oryzae ATCC 44560]